MDHPLYIPHGRERFRTRGGPEEWGTPMPLLHRSITEPEESELMSHVLNDVHYRDTLFNIKGMRSQNARVLTNVDLRHLDKNLAGDVDVLVIPNDEPGQATAIEVKRFQAIVRMNAQGHDEGGSPRRFRKLVEKGIKQANRRKKLGFANVYLWIFVVIDTRERNSGWYTYDGPDSLLRSQIHQAISPVGLDPTIGLLHFEWCQPMDRPPFELSTHGGHLERLATSTAQPSALTEWLRTWPSPIVLPFPR